MLTMNEKAPAANAAQGPGQGTSGDGEAAEGHGRGRDAQDEAQARKGLTPRKGALKSVKYSFDATNLDNRSYGPDQLGVRNRPNDLQSSTHLHVEHGLNAFEADEYD